MSEKRTGVAIVSDLAAELKNGIVLLGGERSWSETRARWLERAARAAGISYRSAAAIFYGEGIPRAETVERVRMAVKSRKARDEANARRESEEFLARLEAVERYIRSVDPDYCGPDAHGYRPACDDVRSQMLRARGEDRAMGEE